MGSGTAHGRPGDSTVLAVDTNVVVRLLVNDDERQAAVARRLFESDEIWIGVTVLLEAAWVLESVH